MVNISLVRDNEWVSDSLFRYIWVRPLLKWKSTNLCTRSWWITCPWTIAIDLFQLWQLSRSICFIFFLLLLILWIIIHRIVIGILKIRLIFVTFLFRFLCQIESFNDKLALLVFFTFFVCKNLYINIIFSNLFYIHVYS